MQNVQTFLPKKHAAKNIFTPLTSPETTPENLTKTIIRIARNAAPLSANTGTYPSAAEEKILISAMIAHPHDDRLKQAIYMIYRYYVMTTAIGFYRALAKISITRANRTREFEEMESHIYPDFINSISKYQPDLGFRLMTFCRSHIYASIQTYCTATGIRTQRRSRRANHIKQYFIHLINKNHSHSEAIAIIASRMNIAASDIEQSLNQDSEISNLNNPISITTPMPGNDGTLTLADTLADTTSPTVLDILSTLEDQETVHTAMKSALAGTSDRDRDIFQKRLQNEETLESLAIRHNISRERVRQIEARIIQKITIAISSQHPTKPVTNRVSLAA